MGVRVFSRALAVTTVVALGAAGSETILWGTPSGLTGTGSDAIAEPESLAVSHRFGYSLAAADFDGDGPAAPQASAERARPPSAPGRWAPADWTRRSASVSAASADAPADRPPGPGRPVPRG